MTEINPGRVAQTRLRKLEAEAIHARQRYDLYKAMSEGPRPTDPTRLKVLEQITEQAEARLAQARAAG